MTKGFVMVFLALGFEFACHFSLHIALKLIAVIAVL